MVSLMNASSANTSWLGQDSINSSTRSHSPPCKLNGQEQALKTYNIYTNINANFKLKQSQKNPIKFKYNLSKTYKELNFSQVSSGGVPDVQH